MPKTSVRMTLSRMTFRRTENNQSAKSNFVDCHPAPRVILQIVILLSVIPLSVNLLRLKMPSVKMLNAILLSVKILSVILLGVILLVPF
jgi:hypothetical protein